MKDDQFECFAQMSSAGLEVRDVCTERGMLSVVQILVLRTGP